MCVPPSRWPFLRRSRFECRSSMKYQTRSTLCLSPTPVARGTPRFVSLPGDTSKNLGCQLRLPVATRILFSNQLPLQRNQLEPARDSTHQNRSSSESSLALRAKDNLLFGPGPVGGTMTSLEDVQFKSSVCSKLHGYREPDVAPFLA